MGGLKSTLKKKTISDSILIAEYTQNIFHWLLCVSYSCLEFYSIRMQKVTEDQAELNIMGRKFL